MPGTTLKKYVGKVREKTSDGWHGPVNQHGGKGGGGGAGRSWSFSALSEFAQEAYKVFKQQKR